MIYKIYKTVRELTSEDSEKFIWPIPKGTYIYVEKNPHLPEIAKIEEPPSLTEEKIPLIDPSVFGTKEHIVEQAERRRKRAELESMLLVFIELNNEHSENRFWFKDVTETKALAKHLKRAVDLDSLEEIANQLNKVVSTFKTFIDEN